MSNFTEVVSSPVFMLKKKKKTREKEILAHGYGFRISKF